MKAFFKTLFGDWINLGFVAAVVALEAVLVNLGFTTQAGLITPLVILLGISWLATN